jgi:hypothetical protein
MHTMQAPQNNNREENMYEQMPLGQKDSFCQRASKRKGRPLHADPLWDLHQKVGRRFFMPRFSRCSDSDERSKQGPLSCRTENHHRYQSQSFFNRSFFPFPDMSKGSIICYQKTWLRAFWRHHLKRRSVVSVLACFLKCQWGFVKKKSLPIETPSFKFTPARCLCAENSPKIVLSSYGRLEIGLGGVWNTQLLGP